MKTKLATVEELNRIQDEWMKLDSSANIIKQQRVFALMKQLPKVYVSGHDGFGVVYISGMPVNQGETFEKAVARCRAYEGRVDVAWNGKTARWYSTGL